MSRRAPGARLALTALLFTWFISLTGCETTAEQSARLARMAHHNRPAQTGLVITHENPHVKVLATTVLHDQNGTAAIVTLRNESKQPLSDVPIAITLNDQHGTTLYQNNAPGLSPALISAPLLMPGREFTWVDDQIQTSGTPGRLSARIGDAVAAAAREPQLSIGGVKPFVDPTSGPGAEGMLLNHSPVPQQELVIYAIAKRAGRIVAAGRAVLPNVAGNSSTHFQVFFIGNPRGASLQLSAPPTSLP